VRHIAGARVREAAVRHDGRRRALRRRLVDVEHHHAGLLRREQAGDGGADSRSGAGDDGNLARQLEHAPA